MVALLTLTLWSLPLLATNVDFRLIVCLLGRADSYTGLEYTSRS